MSIIFEKDKDFKLDLDLYTIQAGCLLVKTTVNNNVWSVCCLAKSDEVDDKAFHIEYNKDDFLLTRVEVLTVKKEVFNDRKHTKSITMYGRK